MAFVTKPLRFRYVIHLFILKTVLGKGPLKFSVCLFTKFSEILSRKELMSRNHLLQGAFNWRLECLDCPASPKSYYRERGWHLRVLKSSQFVCWLQKTSDNPNSLQCSSRVLPRKPGGTRGVRASPWAFVLNSNIYSSKSGFGESRVDFARRPNQFSTNSTSNKSKMKNPMVDWLWLLVIY